MHAHISSPKDRTVVIGRFVGRECISWFCDDDLLSKKRLAPRLRCDELANFCRFCLDFWLLSKFYDILLLIIISNVNICILCFVSALVKWFCLRQYLFILWATCVSYYTNKHFDHSNISFTSQKCRSCSASNTEQFFWHYWCHFHVFLANVYEKR